MRTFAAGHFALDRLLGLKGGVSVDVLLPGRGVAATIGPIVAAVRELRDAGLVDRIVVIDAASEDGTAEVARGVGAEVVQRNDVCEELGPAQGKGDAAWRALAVTSGEIVVIADTDSQDFGPHFVLGLLGPLLEDQSLSYVKGAFDRPLQIGGTRLEREGGRVTELVARPLLQMFAPPLAAFRQPLAGEVAIRRATVERLSLPVGYGLEVAMLMDVARTEGLAATAETDLGSRTDASKPLLELAPMAHEVAATILARAGVETAEGTSVVERPPLDSYRRGRAR